MAHGPEVGQKAGATQRARERAAQAWCTPETKGITMNMVLCETFANILDEEWYKPRTVEDEAEKPGIKARLGYATTRDLLNELYARIEISGGLDYRTVDSK